MATPHIITGLDADQLAHALQARTDHANNAIEPFVDSDGGWPLRCCLGNSSPGDTIAIIAWSPFPWRGPYAETGPVVVHVHGCPNTAPTVLPQDMDQRAMVLRPYGTTNESRTTGFATSPQASRSPTT